MCHADLEPFFKYQKGFTGINYLLNRARFIFHEYFFYYKSYKHMLYSN